VGISTAVLYTVYDESVDVKIENFIASAPPPTERPPTPTSPA